MGWWIRAALALAGLPAFGAIVVEGIQDQQTVIGEASFLVHAEDGYDYQAQLNGEEVSAGVVNEVRRPGFYELEITRREISTKIEEVSRIRFVILDAERGDSEWGLFPWTPSRLVDSAASEFEGGELRIITPAAIPAGMPIPLIALVEAADGTPLRVNGVLRSPHLSEDGIRIKRGIGSGFIAPQNAAGELLFNGSILTIGASQRIQIEEDVSWIAVSGLLDTETIWPENARIHVTSDLTINTNAALTIEQGVIIKLAAGVDIFLHGTLAVNGTADWPVVFAPANVREKWGGFVMWRSPAKATVANAIFTGSGEDAAWFETHDVSRTHRPEQALFFLGPGADAHFVNCSIIANAGQAFNGNNGFLTLESCLVQGCQTVGEFNGGSLRIDDSALLDFPSGGAAYINGDNDALYLTSGNHEIKNTLIGWCKDDGIDAGASDAGQVLVENCWIEACFHEGMALSGVEKIVQVTGTVIVNCGQGIEAGYGAPRVTVRDSLLLHNEVGVRFGDNYTSGHHGSLRVTNSFLLNNYRDIWGMDRASWTEALDRMDLRNNFISEPDPDHPQNLAWNPLSDGSHLARFRAAAGSDSGIGFLSRASTSLPSIPAEVKIGLSTFSPEPVSVAYTIFKTPALGSNPVLIREGRLEFMPGELVKVLRVASTSIEPEVAEVFEIHLAGPSGGEVKSSDSLHRLVLLAPGKDADGDQLPDSWEAGIIQYDPTDERRLIEDVLPEGDFDGDGASNGWEFLAGTDPAFAGDCLRLTASAASMEGIRLEFEAQPGRAYRIEFRNGADERDWRILSRFEAQSAERILSVADILDDGTAMRFYRVVVEQ